MKKLLHILLVIAFILFTSLKVSAQHVNTVTDIFFSLPDTVFTTIQQLNFAAKDSFPVSERRKMKENFDAKRKTFTQSDPRFHITAINEKVNLLSATTGELNFNVKLWNLPNDETLIGVDGNYKEDQMISQTIKFYNYKEGKLTSIKALPEPFLVSNFFEADYAKKNKVDPNLPVPDLFIMFSSTSNELKVCTQPALFDEEIQGTKGKPLTNLSYLKIKHRDLLLEPKDGKLAFKTNN